MQRYMTAAVDGPTSRLLLLAQSIHLRGQAPTKVLSQRIVDGVKAARLLAEARFFDLAGAAVEDARVLVVTGLDDLDVVQAFDRTADGALAALKAQP